ncbi:PAS domain S-box-containing protein [Bryocella elongata]|uniref:histidine kinase n=1 Tax=Bryocella elongata TaxID=863522 RepID=A0A1H5XVV1_9BACT|nr:ATP-binding protein [Bryocella elongata]SEG15376.1 PAS domain S-box-containing protein [Bryocella elongata]
MGRLAPRTFFGQLVFSTILVQTLFLVVFVSYIITSQRRTAEERSRQRLIQELALLSTGCAEDLAKGDDDSVKRILEMSQLTPSIDAARLTDLTGTTIDAVGRGSSRKLDPSEQALLGTSTQQKVFKISNGLLEGVTPVIHDGQPIALLWLEPNHDSTQNTLRMILRVCLTYGGFALLANLLPIFLLVRGITRPLRRLGEATQRLIQNPDAKSAFPLPVTTNNEAGELTTSVNSMVWELEDRRNGLMETVALLDSMLGNAPIGFAFFDRDLRYVRVNDFLADTHGLAPDLHSGRPVSDFYSAEVASRKESCIRQVFETGEAVRDVELSGQPPNSPGTRRSWHMHFYPVRTERESVRWVGAIVVETTERLRTEEALRKTEKLAAAGRLAASVAHEVNNPLEAVTNLLYLLSLHEPLDAEAQEYIATAQSELARVSEITQQTLRFYRQSTSPRQTSVGEVLDSLLTLYKSRLAALNIVVEKKYRGTPEVFGYAGEMRQLFANLVGNALDAMSRGGRLTLSVRRGSGRRNDGVWCEGVCVSVADTGEGIAEDALQRIFEPFFTTKDATGTGLGLWVSAEIIAKHSGTVRVRSRRGVNSGTIFVVFFPDDSTVK